MLVDFRSGPYEFEFNDIGVESFFENLSISVGIFMDIFNVFEAFMIFLVFEHGELELLKRVMCPQVCVDLMEGRGIQEFFVDSKVVDYEGSGCFILPVVVKDTVGDLLALAIAD